MKFKKLKKIDSEYPMLRELIWRDKYVESGINVMIISKTSYCYLEINKRRLDDFNGSAFSFKENLEEVDYF